jgi:isochorismate synthase EntC
MQGFMQSAKGRRDHMGEIFDQNSLALFFRSGGFLRLASGDCLIWPALETLVETPNSNEQPLYSIAYNYFFESQTRLLSSSRGPFRVSSHDFSQVLKAFLESSGASVEEGFAGNADFLKPADFELPPFADFEKDVQTLLGKIQREEIEKGVPVVFSRNLKKPSVNNRAYWIYHLLKTPSTSHVFGFWQQQAGIIGATPEILFHKKDGLLSTMALAGTMPRSEIGQRISLLKDPKEMHEHELVVRDLERQLGKLAPVRVSQPQILELPTLLHLQTLLEVETSERDVHQLIQLLHPTPALGVSPRAYGFHWLQELGNQAGRRLFGGPIAFHIPSEKGSGAEILCLVAIRNMQWDDDGSRMGAGCGIVKESLPEREWREVQHKLSSVQKMLGL